MRRNSTRMVSWFAKPVVAVTVMSILVAITVLAQSKGKETKEAKEENEHPLTNLKIVVTGGAKNLPISNASVYVRYDQPRLLLPAEKIELDLKTDMEGVAVVKDVPRIRVMIQVVKGGWRPFGKYFDLTKADQTVEIKMLPPAHWY
jgi:hypothetical protein